MPGDIPVPALGGIVGCERERPSRSCRRPAAIGGGTGGIPCVRTAYVRGMAGTGTGDAKC
jgi:hypothetical protein